jgi:hypothetical protein
MSIDGRPSEGLLCDLELERGIFRDGLEHADGGRGDLGPDAVAGEDGNFVAGRSARQYEEKWHNHWSKMCGSTVKPGSLHAESML